MGIGTGNHDTAVGHQDCFGVVEARDGGVGHDTHALVDGGSGVVEDGVEVGTACKAEAGDTVGGTVENEICSIWKCGDTRHDPLGRHTLQRPLRICCLRLDGDTIIDGGCSPDRGATTDHDGQGSCIRCVHGHQDCSPFEWVVTPGKEVVD